MASCGICKVAPHKYKCPQCRIRYCSVACFKAHKADGNACSEACVKTNPSAPSSSSSSSSLAASSSDGSWRQYAAQARPVAEDDEDESMPVLTDGQRSGIDGSTAVREALQSDELKVLVASLLGSPNRNAALKAELQNNPRFRAFADQMLLASGLCHPGGMDGGLIYVGMPDVPAR